jgi:hypothetical protein
LVTGLSAYAAGRAQQANFGGDNYAPIVFGGNPAPAPSLHQLPPGINDFSGRVDDVAGIERMAAAGPGEAPRIINVFGAPGVGKSALSVHVAHRLAENLDEVQLYAELGEVDGQVLTSTQVLQWFVAGLDPATIGIPVSAQELPTRYRSLLSGRRCLIVLDNAQSADQIADLVPGTAASVVLVTSRAFLAAVQGVFPYHLGLMSIAESLDLLSSVSRRVWPDGPSPEAAHRLIQQCGRLPLALRIVGAILKKKPHWTLEKLAGDLAEELTRLAKLTEGPLDVRSCFEVSYRHLGEDEALAFRLLSLLPLALFKVRHAASFLQQPEDDAERAVEALIDAQLLETEDGRYFRFHDLLRLYARERSRAAGDDPDNARATRFLRKLAGEFTDAYSRCLRENKWTGPRPDQHGWPPDLDADSRFLASPDALYLPTGLVPVSEPGGQADSWQGLLARHQRALVLGAAGMGKTVLADRICYEIAVTQSSSEQPYDIGFAVPLRQRGDRNQDPETLIADAVRLRYRLDLPQETLAMMLRDHRCVVIFDGFDEVPTRNRSGVIQDISAFCSTYPAASVLLTSRPGPVSAGLTAASFQPYEIAPLADADIAWYVQRWGEVMQAPPDAHASLLNAIRSSEIRREWLSTPLLMAQLIATYDRTGAVPRQEIDLYDMTYAALFERRDSFRGIRRLLALPAETIGWLVSYLAYELQVRAGVFGVSDNEFRRLIKESRLYQEYSPPDERDTQLLIEGIAALYLPVRRAPEETADGEPRWFVTRDPFSEYLAARWIFTTGRFADAAHRLMTMMKARDFTAGSRFVAQIAARQTDFNAQQIADYLHGVLNENSEQLTESARTAIVHLLGRLE